MALLPGARLGPYEVHAPLGSGGMGTVAGEQARSKLLAEARTASTLSHPNVATVHEVGEGEGQPYIVMELVEGTALSTDGEFLYFALTEDEDDNWAMGVVQDEP